MVEEKRNWAHSAVVARPLCMRKVPGSIPGVSISFRIAPLRPPAGHFATHHNVCFLTPQPTPTQRHCDNPFKYDGETRYCLSSTLPRRLLPRHHHHFPTIQNLTIRAFSPSPVSPGCLFHFTAIKERWDMLRALKSLGSSSKLPT